MRALIVDDSETMRRILKTTLLQGDFDLIDEAVDGEDALIKIAAQNYDLILLDWNMPNLSGLEALKKLRAIGNSTPIIMVTSETQKNKVIEAVKSGANNYIIKPFTPDYVLLKIQETLSKNQ